MHALEEERKALREIVDEIDTFGEKDREDINSKFWYSYFFDFIIFSRYTIDIAENSDIFFMYLNIPT
jgi:hypothetical protein